MRGNLWELMGTLCGVTPCVRPCVRGNGVRSNSVRARGNLWEHMGTLCGVTPCVRAWELGNLWELCAE